MKTGYHETNSYGSKLLSGMYYYKLTAGSFSDVKKLLLVR